MIGLDSSIEDEEAEVVYPDRWPCLFRFTNNSGTTGGAIVAAVGSRLDVLGSTFQGNQNLNSQVLPKSCSSILRTLLGFNLNDLF